MSNPGQEQLVSVEMRGSKFESRWTSYHKMFTPRDNVITFLKDLDPTVRLMEVEPKYGEFFIYKENREDGQMTSLRPDDKTQEIENGCILLVTFQEKQAKKFTRINLAS